MFQAYCPKRVFFSSSAAILSLKRVIWFLQLMDTAVNERWVQQGARC